MTDLYEVLSWMIATSPAGLPLVWALIGIVFLVGLWGVIFFDNLVKKVVGLSIVNSAVIMVFVYYGSLSGETAPIDVVPGTPPVDPVPQALMLTAIVVGICIVAVALVLIERLYRRFGSLSMNEIEARVWGVPKGGSHGEET